MAPEIPPTTSASQLATYTMCPRKYAFEYVYELEAEFRSTGLILGSAVHGVVAWWYEERLAGRTPTVTRAREVLSADLLALSADLEVRWKSTTPESLEAEGHALLERYLAWHGDLPVAEVEKLFQIELVDPETGECLGRPLRGYFDLVLQDRTVVELKTSAKGWSEFDLLRHLQIGAYAYTANVLYGSPSTLAVHVLVKLKRDPRIETYHVCRAPKETRWWLEAARAIEASIEAGHFPPKPSPLCHDCEFERACAAWTFERTVARRITGYGCPDYGAIRPVSALVRRREAAAYERIVHS